MNRLIFSRIRSISQPFFLNDLIYRQINPAYRSRTIFTGVNQSWQKAIDKEAQNIDEPIKYFGSQAEKWRAQQTRSGVPLKDDRLWYQPYVVIVSLGVFMIYFCVLREESDIDAELSRNLYERVDGLEEVQLKIVHKYNVENKLSVTEIEGRMKQLGLPVPKYD